MNQQLAASQARCQEMEREIKSLTTCQCEGCDHNLEESAFCLPCMNKAQQQYDQLQATLAELVEGLRRINTLAVHNHTDAFDPMRWLIEIAEGSQHLLTQLEAHRKGGA